MSGDQTRPLRLFNSLGRRLEEFRPVADPVRVFSCGPLVYAFPHLGVLRAYVCVDLIRRALRWKGLPARHVTMVTDINRGTGEAPPSGTLAELADFYTRVFLDDLDAMNVLPAHHFPRASSYLDDMVEFVTELDRKGFAYRTPAGLYFDTSTVDYGTLVPIDPAAQREGVRVEAAPGRRNRTDFALWRFADPRTSPMGWDSPWGWGLPGGHLACSTIAIGLLGTHVDIHTGGKHHRQLHHVNEIAQSEAYLGAGQPWVRFWLHHDALTFGTQPMVRGRAPRLAELTAAGVHPMACRLLLLGGHYRSRQSFTGEALAAARSTLRNLVSRVRRLGGLPAASSHQAAAVQLAGAPPQALALLDRLDAAICADLNAPEVLATLHEVLRAPGLADGSRRVLVAAADAILGLRLADLDPDELTAAGRVPAPAPETVESLIAARAAARRRRDWARADEIRSTLESLGVRVADLPVGSREQ